ncbi:MAG: hypothetical protein WCT49_04280 [Candidatus Paceibacterota bacterium]|jgi:hypothetical protein|nr:hypothetical protein [Candidatus Paceibacterota bacterium]
MSKYKELNRLEAILNTLGGDENISGILRNEIKVDLNTVHRELKEVKDRYWRELPAAGAIVLGDMKQGVRDIIFPVRCVGSEQEAYEKMRKVMNERVRTPDVQHSLDSKVLIEKNVYVSLRNTMEFERGVIGANSYLTGRDLFCFITRYSEIFLKDWFDDKPSILPEACGARNGWLGRCILWPNPDEAKPTIQYVTSGDLITESRPWMTVVADQS